MEFSMIPYGECTSTRYFVTLCICRLKSSMPIGMLFANSIAYFVQKIKRKLLDLTPPSSPIIQ